MTGSSNQPHGAGFAPVHYGQTQEAVRPLSDSEKAHIRSDLGWRAYVPGLNTIPETFDQLRPAQQKSLMLNIMTDAKKEHASLLVRETYNRIWLAGDMIQAYLRLPGFRMIIRTENPKGTAGKSLLSLYVETRIKQHNPGVNVVHIGATTARRNNTADQHAGIDPNDTSIMRHSGFTDRNQRDEFTQYDELMAVLPLTPFGVGYIPADRPPKTDTDSLAEAAFVSNDEDLEASEPAKYTPTMYRKDLELLLRTHRVVVEDGANDDIVDGSIPDIAARYATVIMYVGNYAASVNLLRVGSCMREFLGLRNIVRQPTGTMRRDGRHYPLSQKVRNAVVVVTNVPDGDIVDFDSYTNMVGATREMIHEGATVTIHRDPYMMKETNGRINPVNPHKIRLSTLLEIDELIVELCHASAVTLGIKDEHITEMRNERLRVSNFRTEGFHPQAMRINSLGQQLPWEDFVLPSASPPRVNMTAAQAAELLGEQPVLQQLPPAAPRIPQQAAYAQPGNQPPAVWPPTPQATPTVPVQSYQADPGPFFPAQVTLSGVKNGYNHTDAFGPPRHGAS